MGKGIDIDLDQVLRDPWRGWARVAAGLEKLDRAARRVPFLPEDPLEPRLQGAFNGFLDVADRLLFSPALAYRSRNLWSLGHYPAPVAVREMHKEPNHSFAHALSPDDHDSLI